MRAGAWVKLPDGREGTVVYNGLDGVGIKWGRHVVTAADIEAASGGRNNMFDVAPPDYPYHPDAMLRDAYPGADASLEYVGARFTCWDVDDWEDSKDFCSCGHWRREHKDGPCSVESTVEGERFYCPCTAFEEDDDWETETIGVDDER